MLTLKQSSFNMAKKLEIDDTPDFVFFYKIGKFTTNATDVSGIGWGFFVVNINFKIVSYSFLKLSRK